MQCGAGATWGCIAWRASSMRRRMGVQHDLHHTHNSTAQHNLYHGHQQGSTARGLGMHPPTINHPSRYYRSTPACRHAALLNRRILIMTIINLIAGTLQATPGLDGWRITSAQAIAEGAEDVPLSRGDYISISGNVYRYGQCIANIAQSYPSAPCYRARRAYLWAIIGGL